MGNQTSQVKVVIVAPSGRVENHSSFDEKTKSMILNLCRKNWQTVTNACFQHPHLREELTEPLRKAVNAEFKEYCISTRLLGSQLDSSPIPSRLAPIPSRLRSSLSLPFAINKACALGRGSRQLRRLLYVFSGMFMLQVKFNFR